jgi:hypothetical protein
MFLVQQRPGRDACAIERVTPAKHTVHGLNGIGYVPLRNIGIETGATMKHPPRISHIRHIPSRKIRIENDATIKTSSLD